MLVVLINILKYFIFPKICIHLIIHPQNGSREKAIG